MKKRFIIAIALVFIAFGAYKGTMAVFYNETKLDSPIDAGKLGIEIINSSKEGSSDVIEFGNVMPGSAVEDIVSIQNAKDKDLYVRVTMTRYWTKDGKKVSDADATYIHPTTKNGSNWLVMKDDGYSNNEVIYFYYKLPVTSGMKTDNMIDEITFSADITDDKYREYKAYVKLEAEAVQCISAEDAILSQWGVEATFDENGTLTEIVE